MKLRWSIRRALLDPAKGREQSGSRPVLILSNEAFNRNSGLVTAVPLTSARREPKPWEVLVPANLSGLPSDSLLLPQQLRTLSLERLRDPAYGRITDPVLRQRIAVKVLEHIGLQDLARLAMED